MIEWMLCDRGEIVMKVMAPGTSTAKQVREIALRQYNNSTPTKPYHIEAPMAARQRIWFADVVPSPKARRKRS